MKCGEYIARPTGTKPSKLYKYCDKCAAERRLESNRRNREQGRTYRELYYKRQKLREAGIDPSTPGAMDIDLDGIGFGSNAKLRHEIRNALLRERDRRAAPVAETVTIANGVRVVRRGVVPLGGYTTRTRIWP